MRSVAVIPARMGASRFPGKPLAKLLGKPMIEHVWRRTAACRALSEVVIATCDAEIAEAARAFGARAVMTSAAHERASDRVAEAALGLEAEVVVMVQGDEPMIRPDMIDAALAPFSDPAVLCVNLVAPIRTEAELEDRNTIKVVMDASGDALYFSREAIPTRARLPFGPGRFHKQVCVIPFRRDFLFRYAGLPQTPLEKAESIDMLRVLEHGGRVRMVPVDAESYAVDTPDDLRRVEAALAREER